jgi:hypothetical protein
MIGLGKLNACSIVYNGPRVKIGRVLSRQTCQTVVGLYFLVYLSYRYCAPPCFYTMLGVVGVVAGQAHLQMRSWTAFVNLSKQKLKGYLQVQRAMAVRFLFLF